MVLAEASSCLVDVRGATELLMQSVHCLAVAAYAKVRAFGFRPFRQHFAVFVDFSA
jgi:hypothetical protein